MQPNCSPAQADRDLPSPLNRTCESRLMSKLLFTILHWVCGSSKVWWCNSKMKSVQVQRAERCCLTNVCSGEWSDWQIWRKGTISLAGHTVVGPEKSFASDQIYLLKVLSPFFQTWESLEIKGIKEKCKVLDTQVIFHTTLSFLPCQQRHPCPL